jgi:MFS family permease
MTRVKGAAHQTFRALGSHNYRLYFFGQIISVSGTWMQSVALGWLVLQLTGSGTWLGLVIAFQFLPMLVLGPMGGVVADRVDKRRFLFATQAVSGVLAAALGLIVLTGSVQLWMVFAFALALGIVNAFDMPARQTFVFEMVGPDLLTNAVTLNSVVMNGARIVGPAIAGVLIASVGIASCFLINGLSYLACIAGLALMHVADLVAAEPRPREKGQLREGFRYVWGDSSLRTPLLLMAAIGTLTYEFQITLPLIAQYTFGAGASGYGALTSAMGLGAVIGGLVAASRARPTRRKLGIAGIVFGTAVLLASVMPTFGAMLIRSSAPPASPSSRCPTPACSSRPAPRCAVGSWRSTPWPSWAARRSADRSWDGSARPSDPGPPSCSEASPPSPPPRWPGARSTARPPATRSTRCPTNTSPASSGSQWSRPSSWTPRC